jgi:hypothetical protein
MWDKIGTKDWKRQYEQQPPPPPPKFGSLKTEVILLCTVLRRAKHPSIVASYAPRGHSRTQVSSAVFHHKLGQNFCQCCSREVIRNKSKTMDGKSISCRAEIPEHTALQAGRWKINCYCLGGYVMQQKKIALETGLNFNSAFKVCKTPLM